ncbi:SpoIID/LytB domain-containing protein [Demequina sp. SO4-13]|uniref:SpoIID/LytB domain-containing protein n=1 Tax=Demequina sp. SO4-13 TaxID=3401027 RepID=UPI003AF9A6C7
MTSPTPRRLRRAVAAAVAAVLLVPAMASAASAAAPARFKDVPDSHAFLEEITWLAQEDITTGYSDGTFRPRAEVTRDAFAAFLYRLEGSPTVTLPAKSPFKDITPTNTDFYEAIVWLEKQGITNGWEVSGGTEFRPFNTITRDAMAAFLYRYEGEPTVTLPAKSPFKDITPTNTDFYEEIVWLDKTGISTGWSDGTFRPYDGVTREATAAFFYRLSGSPDVVVPANIPKSFTIKGAGFGHGVGMSQYGAQGMAVDGRSAGDILRHYYQGTTVATVNSDKEVKTEIFGSGSDSRDRVVLVVNSPGSSSTTGGQWRLMFYNEGDAGSHDTWTGKKGEKLTIIRDVRPNGDNEIVVERADGSRQRATRQLQFQWEATDFYQSTSSENPYVQLLKTNGDRATHGDYRHGRMVIRVPSETYPRLIVSNWTELNSEYLYGIAEMPSSWDPDALQAQAIVARGYALRQMQSYSENCVCHLYDDTRSQNFTGWRKENEGTDAYYGKRWMSAVNATTSSSGRDGKVLKYGGAIATTYYFSSSGGRTENSDDIWVSQPGYLKAVDDKWSLESRNPNKAWTRTLTQAQASSMFGMSNVVSIKVTSRTSGSSMAAATKVTATSSTGQTKSITGAETIRSKVVGGKSPWIWSFTAKY